MSGNDFVTDDLAVPPNVNIEDSECREDKSNSFSYLTFCCDCCFRRRNKTNIAQRRKKKKRRKRSEEEDLTGAIPPDKQEQQRKGQDRWSIVSLDERDHGDEVTLGAKPYSMEIQDNLSAVLLGVHYNEEKQEQKHLNAVTPNAHYMEQQRKDRQNYLNNLPPAARCEMAKQGQQDQISAVSEGAPTNEELVFQGAPYKEKQQPTGPEHFSTLGETHEKEKQERQEDVSTECEGAPSKEEQDCQGIPHREEQQPMGPNHSNNTSLGVTYKQENQGGEEHMSSESEGEVYQEEQDYQEVPHKEEQQPIIPEQSNNISLRVTFEQEKQGRQDHVSSESGGAPFKENQACQEVLDTQGQEPMGPENPNNLFMGRISEQEEQEGQDHVSSEPEGAFSKQEQDYLCVPYQEEQQRIGPEPMSTLFLGITYEKEQQIGKVHENAASASASYKEKQSYHSAPYSEQQEVMGPEQLNTLSLSGILDEEQWVKQDPLISKCPGVLSEMDKEVGQDHQSNLFLLVPYDEGERQCGQDHQNTMLLSVPWDSEQELQGGQDPQTIISLYMPWDEEEEEEKQSLVNTMILCVPCDKEEHQEGQNVLCPPSEEEMKQQDGQQDHLSPSLCVACEEDEKEEEEQDLLNTTFLYEL